MKRVGEMIYNMRIVKTYRARGIEDKPFNWFVGIIVWCTWDTGDWQVIRTWLEDGKYMTKELGIIDDSHIPDCYNSRQLASFIKKNVIHLMKVDECLVSSSEIQKCLMEAGVIESTKTSKIITRYINKKVKKLMYENLDSMLAVDDIIATIIENRR